MVPCILISADIKTREVEAEKRLQNLNLSKNHHNILWLGEGERLGIEQARKIREFLSLKPYQGKNQAVVLLTAENLTLDAQNALLKTLEELPQEALIILGVSVEENLLPTITSRCQIIYLQKTPCSTPEVAQKFPKEIEKLSSQNWEQRFQYIEKLDNREGFLQALIIYFRQKLLEDTLGGATNPPPRWTEDNQFLANLLEAEKWAKQNVNIRAILEYLMLKMPQENN